MLQKKVLLGLTVFACFLPFSAFAYTIYPEMTEQQKENFYQSLEREIQNSEKQLKNKYLEIRSGKQFINPAAKIEHDALVGSLEAKRILMTNFRNAPSIRSPKVREKLLSIMKKKIVTPDDLYELDDLVLQERKKTEG